MSARIAGSGSDWRGSYELIVKKIRFGSKSA
jgi:hypothetical protein